MSDHPDYDRLSALRADINRHNYAYYVNNESTITDADYDALMRELQHIESDHPEWVSADSPTQRVGAKPDKGFVTVSHPVPMLSLDNAFSDDDLQDFDRRVSERLATFAPDIVETPNTQDLFSDHASVDNSITYCAEPKLDGLAVKIGRAHV